MPALALFCKTRTTTRRFSACPSAVLSLPTWWLSPIAPGALLKQDIGHRSSAVLIKLLVQFDAANGEALAFHLDHVAVDSFGLPCQGR